MTIPFLPDFGEGAVMKRNPRKLKNLVAIAVAGVVAGNANAFDTYTQATWNAFVQDVNAGTAIIFDAPDLYGYIYMSGINGSCTASGSCYQVSTLSPQQITGITPASLQSFISTTNTQLSTASVCQNTVLGGTGYTTTRSYLIVDSNLPDPTCLKSIEQIAAKYFPARDGSAITPPPVASTVSEVAAVVSSQAQRSTSIQQATIISSMLSSISNRGIGAGPRRVALGEQKGMAAGGEAPGWNIWANVSGSKVGQAAVFDGDVQNDIGGIDYALNGEAVVGVSVGNDTSKIDLFGTKLKSTGRMIAPYISYQFNETYSIDAVAGYATGDSTYTAGTTGKQDIRRTFSALNANGNWWFADWQVTGKAGYIDAEEKLNSFVDGSGANVAGSINRVKQVRIGAQVAYWFDGVMPYLAVTHVRDLNDPTYSGVTTPAGKEANNVALGVNFLQGKELTGSVAYSSERGRSNSKNDVFMASLSYRF
jgi:hypothetical protein